jgi:hypothetical protein
MINGRTARPDDRTTAEEAPMIFLISKLIRQLKRRSKS